MYTDLKKEEACDLHDTIISKCKDIVKSNKIILVDDDSRLLVSKNKLSELTLNVIYAKDYSDDDLYVSALYSDVKAQTNVVYNFIITPEGRYISPNNMIFNNYPGLTKTLPHHLFKELADYANCEM